MEFEDFDVEYRRVLEAVKRGSGTAELGPAVERLHALAAELTDPADRADAGHDLEMLKDILGAEPAQPRSAVLEAANQAYAAAARDGGTPVERIERVQQGIEELGRLADQADPDDQTSIYGLNESLHTLASALRSDL